MNLFEILSRPENTEAQVQAQVAQATAGFNVKTQELQTQITKLEADLASIPGEEQTALRQGNAVGVEHAFSLSQKRENLRAEIRSLQELIEQRNEFIATLSGVQQEQ